MPFTLSFLKYYIFVDKLYYLIADIINPYQIIIDKAEQFINKEQRIDTKITRSPSNEGSSIVFLILFA